jgi:hypothetical protein
MAFHANVQLRHAANPVCGRRSREVMAGVVAPLASIHRRTLSDRFLES